MLVGGEVLVGGVAESTLLVGTPALLLHRSRELDTVLLPCTNKQLLATQDASLADIGGRTLRCSFSRGLGKGTNTLCRKEKNMRVRVLSVDATQSDQFLISPAC